MRNKALLVLVCILVTLVSLVTRVSAEELNTKPSSGELINKAWEAHGRRDIEATFKYTNQLIELYKEQADSEQKYLKELPKTREEIENVHALNDVAVAYFIQAESYMRQQSLEDAKKFFRFIIDNYYYAQGWDQRGWYWQIAEVSKQSIEKIETGSIELEKKKPVSQLVTRIVLDDSGKEDFVNYEKYGEFKNIGTRDYKYIIKDQEGLSVAVGEGVYPNTTSVRRDPEFKKAKKTRRLEGSHWDFVQSPDLQAAFLKWAAQAPEPRGVKLFYTGLILEKSGLIKQAIKCYYAIVVHFPGSYGWTYWHTPWYVGQAAIAKIEYLLRRYPNLGYKLVDADIKIINGYDNELSNDITVTNPGRFVKVGLWEKMKKHLKPQAHTIKKMRGKGKVHLLQCKEGDWELIVNNQPYIIQGVTYAPTKVGQSPDDQTMTNWMRDDSNRNGKIDGPYDAFVDKNLNNIQDKDEPSVGDFRLLKEMKVNTIRLYHQPFVVNKELLRDLFKTYGIRVIMGDFLGKYTLGSGAPWNPGTDYNNEEHKKNMIASVTQMVKEHKDEPYVLFWVLGNENVYGYACNADKEPEAYFKFANEVAKIIKEIDPEHPVAICSGDTLFLDKFGKYAPDIDIFGTNAYRGEYGFGRLWKDVLEEADRPVFITEFGCSAYAEGKSREEAEELQAEYHRGCWENIRQNLAFAGGAGNAIGAVAFEWLDEWWKAYEPARHDWKGQFYGPFPDGYMHEEWLGICGQGDGSKSPFMRVLRKSYYTYKKLWQN